MAEHLWRARALAALTLPAISILGLASSAPPARAHGESIQDIAGVIEEKSPSLARVRVRVVEGGATTLELANETSTDVEVLSSRGEPFLRIGPRGVEANVNSRDWYASGNREGVAAPPIDARIGRSPRWRRASRTPRWTWFEHRLHPADVEVPEELREGAERRRLGNWAVPLRYGGRPASIEGYVEYRPLLGQIVPSLTSSPQPVSGVVTAILPGPVPGIFLDASATRETVTVLGASGEPFLRFGRGGVEANVRSPTQHAEARIRGGRPSAPADPRARPDWRLVTASPRHSWLEPRGRYMREEPPDDVVEGGRRRTLRRWTVPLEVGGRRTELRGATSWVPTAAARSREPGSGLTGLGIGAIGVLTVAAIGAAALVGRPGRRRRAGQAG